jgi:FkbM family methyltransferase
MYICNIFVFEPVKKYYEDIKKRFEHNDKILVFNYGLSNKNMEIDVGIADDGTSIYNKNSTNKEKIRLHMASEFINANNIKEIDLIKINIEGGEYDLLEHIIETGLIKKCHDIQVQFHDFVPNALSRMQNIRKQLEKTHKPTYKVDFIWENWQKIQ